MKTSYIVLIVLAVLFFVWIAWGYFSVKSIERLAYTVLDDSKEYEIRQIEKHIVAEVTVTGSYQDATNKGFRKVADYIFGNNVSSDKVAMTTPVINTEEEGAQNQIIAFVMPSRYTMETLPLPNNDEVTLREVEGEKVAVLQFTWWATANRVEKQKQKLLSYLERDGLTYNAVQSARYNPPWTPPFMLRNEVWAVLTKE